MSKRFLNGSFTLLPNVTKFATDGRSTGIHFVYPWSGKNIIWKTYSHWLDYYLKLLYCNFVVNCMFDLT